jgi:hypothetical protein
MAVANLGLEEMTGSVEEQLTATLSGVSLTAIRSFCERLPDLPKPSYANALLGMGYQYESFDLLFAVIAANIQETHDESDYKARYQTMQNLLRPFASEYGIEPDRPLLNPHRKLFADFYRIATGKAWPSHYPANDDNPWLECGRRWANAMLSNLRRSDLGTFDRAKYNLGYHWAVEHLSVAEFGNLKVAWHAVDVDAAYLNAHCEVEEEHAGCAAAAIVSFASTNDPLVVRGVRDHEDDLANFYNECVELIGKERSV